ncbi:helix-turn-helix domain-containing protein [Streptomyces heilongjiangensis]|uniref:Helix-turn-helix domain-containing protein n=1 Tax=Streptomyces heilongjiangensis TaxID=945052 RepID=A0ABW1BEH0_9ACTN|nr:leucine zipper domain-containing protein [Streptomyces heilongjiangensis]MDC2949297.1 leucine zipper domain-containing protein [Streptomyces heilongjiangensis]
MSHRNARLTVHGRRLLIERVRRGRPVARVAAEMGISRATAHKWMRRWRSQACRSKTPRPARPEIPEKSQGHPRVPPCPVFVQVRRGFALHFRRAFRCPGRSRSAPPPC